STLGERPPKTRGPSQTGSERAVLLGDKVRPVFRTCWNAGGETMRMLGTRSARFGAAMAALLVLASCSFVTQPVSGPGTIGLPQGFDLAQVGYQRSEHSVGGSARGYSATAPLTADGKLSVAADDAVVPYKTRVVA